MNVQMILFYIFSFIAITSAVGVITFRNTVHSAVSLLLTFFSIAALFLLLEAEFLAAAQLYIYAGAIMVLVIFVIMLVDIKESTDSPYRASLTAVSVFIGLAVFLIFLFTISTANFMAPRGIYDAAYLIKHGGQTNVIGKVLYSEYIFPFEVSSILLLVAMIGAIILPTRRRFRRDLIGKNKGDAV